MKKIILLLLVTFATGSIVKAQVVEAHAGHLEKRAIGSFKGIQVSEGIEVVISAGSEEALAVSANDESYLSKITTKVSDGILKIGRDDEWKFWNKIKNWKIKVFVSYKTLNYLKATSGAILRGSLQAEQLEVQVNSGAILQLKGSTSVLDANASSGAILKGHDLVAQIVKVKATSGAIAEVYGQKEIDATANSGASVSYAGEGVIKNVQSNSGASIRRRKA